MGTNRLHFFFFSPVLISKSQLDRALEIKSHGMVVFWMNRTGQFTVMRTAVERAEEKASGRAGLGGFAIAYA